MAAISINKQLGPLAQGQQGNYVLTVSALLAANATLTITPPTGTHIIAVWKDTDHDGVNDTGEMQITVNSGGMNIGALLLGIPAYIGVTVKADYTAPLGTFQIHNVLTAVTTATVNNNVTIVKPLSIVKTAASPHNPASVGDIITYTFKVTNNGSNPMTNVTIHDSKLGSPIVIGVIAGGVTVTRTATYTVTQADSDVPP
jgi:hypothetical protein